MTDAVVATIGDNRPPDESEILRDRLATQHADIVKRAEELLDAAERVPERIDDEETATTLSDFLARQIGTDKKGCIGELSARRTAEKAPYLEGGRVVDGFFKKWTDALEKVKKALNARLTDYDRRKAAEERRRREEEERKAREAAEAAAREAEERAKQLASEQDLDDAIAAEETAKAAEAAAQRAEAEAKAKPADLSRARSDHGTTRSLRSTWTGEVTSRDDLDLETLRPHIPQPALEQAVRAFVKSGGRDLKGARIYEKQETVSL